MVIELNRSSPTIESKSISLLYLLIALLVNRWGFHRDSPRTCSSNLRRHVADWHCIDRKSVYLDRAGVA